MKHTINEELIRKNVARYLAGKMSLQEFNRWFIPATWDIEKWAAPLIQKLANGIKLRLAEYDHGHWTKSELRDRISLLLNSHKGSNSRKSKPSTATRGKQSGIA